MKRVQTITNVPVLRGGDYQVSFGGGVCLLFVTLVICSNGGCALKTEVAHTKGRWVGVVESATLQDRRGHFYDALVLSGLRGTPLKERVEVTCGGGHAPILVAHQGDSNLRALASDALPIGRRVSVRGTTAVLIVFARLKDTGGGDVAVYRNKREPRYPSDDHVLIVDDWRLAPE